MKGPHERVKYDFRRLWECPVCNHRERAAGEFPAHVCGCQQAVPLVNQLVMRLVEEGGRRVTPEFIHPAAGQTIVIVAPAAAALNVTIVSPPLPEGPTIIEISAAPTEPIVERTDDPAT